MTVPVPFDANHYRSKYQLPGWLRGPLTRAHYKLLGSRRGHEPDALFDPGFFLQQVKRRGLPPVGLRNAWSTYLHNPAYWSVDPHLRAFFPSEPFSSSAPSSNPLIATSPLRAADAPMGYGNPLLDAGWWVQEHGLAPDASLREVLDHANRAAGDAAGRHAAVALGPPLDVLIINGEDHCPACSQYRVWNPAQALRSNGLRVAIVDAQDIVDDRLRGVDLSARAVIIFRARVDGQLLGVVDALRAGGAKIGFDCDDLIFDRPHTVGMQPDEFGHRDVRSVNRHSAGMAPFIERADFAVVPTPTLGRVLIDAGVPAARVWTCPSFLSPAQVALFQSFDGSRDPNVVSIASGTWTHQEDVRPVIGPLARFMQRNPSVRLRVFGALALDRFPELQSLADRIDQDPHVVRDWNAYVQRYAQASVNLVSMDFDNGFCHGKSEVKYMEASLAGTATIATRIAAFQRALGGSGSHLLARDESDWVGALEAIVGNATTMTTAREAAHADVLSRYGPDGTHAALYVDAVRAVLSGGSRAEPDVIPCRWTIRAADDVADARFADVARHLGATGVHVIREPRGENVIAPSADAATASSRLIPWVDPDVFFRRGGNASPMQPANIALIAPPASLDAMASGPLARSWAAHADAHGATLTVIGARGAELGLPRADHWAPGGSEIELATLLRRADLAVQLSEDWSEELVGAMLVGTPTALLDPSARDSSLPVGWRVVYGDDAP